MFTGLIEEIGTISEIKKSNSSMVLGITAKRFWKIQNLATV